MEVQFKASKDFIVKAEGTTHAELFDNLCGLVEVFSVSQCGACKGDKILPIKRTVDDDVHYEYKCMSPKCGARLTLSKSKTGGSLYPRRKYNPKQSIVKSGKAKAGDWVPNGGWEIYKGERNDEDTDE